MTSEAVYKHMKLRSRPHNAIDVNSTWDKKKHGKSAAQKALDKLTDDDLNAKMTKQKAPVVQKPTTFILKEVRVIVSRIPTESLLAISEASSITVPRILTASSVLSEANEFFKMFLLACKENDYEIRNFNTNQQCSELYNSIKRKRISSTSSTNICTLLKKRPKTSLELNPDEESAQQMQKKNVIPNSVIQNLSSKPSEEFSMSKNETVYSALQVKHVQGIVEKELKNSTEPNCVSILNFPRQHKVYPHLTTYFQHFIKKFDGNPFAICLDINYLLNYCIPKAYDHIFVINNDQIMDSYHEDKKEKDTELLATLCKLVPEYKAKKVLYILNGLSLHNFRKVTKILERHKVNFYVINSAETSFVYDYVRPDRYFLANEELMNDIKSCNSDNITSEEFKKENTELYFVGCNIRYFKHLFSMMSDEVKHFLFTIFNSEKSESIQKQILNKNLCRRLLDADYTLDYSITRYTQVKSKEDLNDEMKYNLLVLLDRIGLFCKTEYIRKFLKEEMKSELYALCDTNTVGFKLTWAYANIIYNVDGQADGNSLDQFVKLQQSLIRHLNEFYLPKENLIKNRNNSGSSNWNDNTLTNFVKESLCNICTDGGVELQINDNGTVDIIFRDKGVYVYVEVKQKKNVTIDSSLQICRSNETQNVDKIIKLVISISRKNNNKDIDVTIIAIIRNYKTTTNVAVFVDNYNHCVDLIKSTR